MSKGIYKRTQKEKERLKTQWIKSGQKTRFQNNKSGYWKGKTSPLKGTGKYSGLTRKQVGLLQREEMIGRKRPEQCEICGAFGNEFVKGLCLDHNHETGEYRGWICTRCNCILGHAKEKIEILELVIKYIKHHE